MRKAAGVPTRAARAQFQQNKTMKNENKLFAEFKPSTYEEWYVEAEKLLKGAPFDKKMLTKTPEGITLKPIYNKEDMTFDVSLPGFDDYVRGTSAAGNKASPWKISQELCAGTPEEFNAKILDALNKGQTSIEIVLDEASAHAVDADKSEKGKVAHKGLSISCAKDFDAALKGVETDCVEINIRTASAAADIAAALYASQKGKNLKGGIFFDPISELAKTGKLNRSLECAFGEMAALASYNAKNLPEFTAVGVDTMAYSSAGASAVEELGAAFATAVAYIRAMLERSMTIDEAASQIRFRVALGGNFFMEIAKIRAARMIWAKIVEEFGGDENSRKIKLGARTAIFNKTVYDPYVNMLRTATEAFSGVVGGVDTMTVGAFDEIIRNPDEFSERIARNQQIILQEECNLTDVIDPAGGSYYVENLTRELAAKVWQFFAKIEEQGGIVKALESGFVQDSIAQTAAGKKKLYDTRRSSVVGTNNYANLGEKLLEKGECKCAELFKARAEKVAALRKDVAVDLGGAKGADAIAKLVSAAEAGATISALESAICKCNSSVEVKPLAIHRAVEHFEALRKASAEYKAKNGFGPKLFLATMGPLIQHKIRADFIRGFFEVGGFEVIYPNGFADGAEAAKAFAESGAKFAVVCSTDDTYPALVPDVVKSIKAVKPDAKVFLAGIPAPEAEPSYKEAGLDGSVNIKSNNYETLKSMLAEIGVL